MRGRDEGEGVRELRVESGGEDRRSDRREDNGECSVKTGGDRREDRGEGRVNATWKKGPEETASARADGWGRTGR
ncbi:hypothetical protein GCM10011321_42980 [Youhaiella tibetensis]|nr:hypothetical protein GCM10011321_42980 [Youhaiella tibetensis]